ncbi:MAG: glycine cleavage system aminomethyltransferase GcvT [Myxococcales bacterium]|nr:MAG: glycine cleavage system aminomethyltransferase GcvT [Myxococcales bacterium]
MAKAYFVGQRLVKDAAPAPADRVAFAWKEPDAPLRRTTLFAEHQKRTKKIVPFAGWEMPVWYASTMEEHRAVRQAAALFDVSHMGTFEISGEHATDFLDFATTNYAKWSRDGESFYSYLLDPDGDIIDDIMVYRLSRTRYLMVVNAANEAKDWAWLNLVNDGKAVTDRDVPQRRVLIPATLRDLKDPRWGAERRVDVAFQGPKSRDVLLKLLDPAERQRLKAMKRTGCGEYTLAGLPVVIARTGYTGESIGFEIFVHPDRAPELWNAILAAGQPHGATIAGLGARDSLRTEAGLPLYGHELAGPHNISPLGAGFGSYVKLHKPFFIGKAGLLKQEAARDKVIVRFAVPGKGAKPVRPGDPVASARGAFIGVVTSSVVDGEGRQVGLAYVQLKAAKPGPVAIFPLPGEKDRDEIVPPTKLGEKARTLLPVQAEIVERFPKRADSLDMVRTEGQIALEMID